MFNFLFNVIGLGNAMGRKRFPGRLTRRIDRNTPNRRQYSGFGQVSDLIPILEYRLKIIAQKTCYDSG